MIDAISSVSEMSALGFGLPKNTFKEKLEGGT